ncbi:MAG: 3-dehydroquinate synthase [Bellilinea sp.]|jgi:3-dehydroquinate synthase
MSGAFLFIYGPPGSGKTTLGALLAEQLELPFYDLDDRIEAATGMTIAEIFAHQAEPGFRRREREALRDLLCQPPGVAALGGGALLDADNRRAAEDAGRVLCLSANPTVLLERLRQADPAARPLLAAENGDTAARLFHLLEERSAHYASFELGVDVTRLTVSEAARAAMTALGAFRVSGMGQPYDVRINPAGLDFLPAHLKRLECSGKVGLVCDENLVRRFAPRVERSLRNAGLSVHCFTFAAGEHNKTLATVSRLWQEFVLAGLERASLIVSLGGGVTGDLAGFAAAAYLRGVAWVNLPTTLLAMVDASIGGKTGIDLPQGKNLVGAFHPPRLVLADPLALDDLPLPELRSGMAEVVKHAVIGDPALLEVCACGLDALAQNWDAVVRRAVAVKIAFIQADPFERGLREVLNFGHTIGHAVEQASGYRLRHGEAVAIGMVLETRLAERIGLAQVGLSQTLAEALRGLGLPVEMPAGLDEAALRMFIGADKKRRAGRLRFSLPRQFGQVEHGVVVEDEKWLSEVLR